METTSTEKTHRPCLQAALNWTEHALAAERGTGVAKEHIREALRRLRCALPHSTEPEEPDVMPLRIGLKLVSSRHANKVLSMTWQSERELAVQFTSVHNRSCIALLTLAVDEGSPAWDALEDQCGGNGLFPWALVTFEIGGE